MKNLYFLILLNTFTFSGSFSYTARTALEIYNEALQAYNMHEYKKAINTLEFCQQYTKYSQCSVLLAHIYDNVEGAAKEGSKAIDSYKKAIENGDKKSLHNLANHYYKNGDMENAKVYFRRSVDAGYFASMYNLGRIYEKQNNLKEALQCYHAASEHSIPQADYSLARYYYKHKNIQLTKYYFNKAAKLGFQPAINALGQLKSL